jgi:UDP-N-acetylmuramoyl-L-alanyl-D-glutamate--2,6-diaminopimelate ligase
VATALASGKRGVVVVNADDEGARSIESYAGGCRMLRYSMNDAPGVDVSARDEVVRPDGSTFVLRTPEHEAPVTIQLPGRYNIANALAAATTGYALGLRIDTIATGLESLTSVPGRMERIDQGQPFTVIVDYAHSPEAIRSVLDEVRRIASGRVLVLFGSAGERDVEKRPLQGAVAIRSADFAMFTSEDPRFEDPDAIIEAIAAGATEAGGRRGVDFDCIEDRREAITAILKRAEPGDVVVLAGKGHERSMIYGDKKRPWSEADIAASALRELGYGDVTTQEWST